MRIRNPGKMYSSQYGTNLWSNNKSKRVANGHQILKTFIAKPDNYDRLGPAHPDELVDGPDTPPGQLRQQDHALHKNDTNQ
jgi:hypothetical protein